jgi:aspartyl-tRNA(Asn)/glutamyl-tRNA(Gln) amidotransferase subunit A
MAFDGRTRVVTLPGVFITETAPAGDGTTLAVKDLFDTAGVRTTYGSAVFADHVPDATAEAVTRLERAGYASVGKANLHEFAWGITSENPHYGWVPNPIAEGRIAGGSSGGCAAALAAGLADAALGTDSAGSIRIPAACCGVTGFKPTHGLVPIDGCFPLAKSFDHAGPMARDVAGCARMMEALAPGLEAPALDSLADLRVGVAWTDRADPLVRERVEAATAAFPGARALDLPLPGVVYPAFSREAAEVHGELFRAHRDLYGENVATKLERAFALSDAEVGAAWAERDPTREQIAALTAHVDLVVCPTLEMVAPAAGVGDLALRERVILLTFPWSVVGAPVLALPCGPAELGLPASLQLVGRPGDDALVLAAGALLERAIASRGGASGTL